MRSNSIGNVLFTKTQQKVLSLLYGRAEQSFYLNEIVRLSDMGKGTIKRELERMQASGIVSQKRIGNQNHYQANKGCPIYPELLGIVRKTFGVADVIKEALQPRTEQIIMAFIYGSVAKAQDTANSDIDLMVISDELAYAEVMELLFAAEQSLGRPINPTIYGSNEVTKKMKQDNVFVSRVMEQPKLWIKGDENAINTIGKFSTHRKP
jgi:predicted nucleotidyltransferase